MCESQVEGAEGVVGVENADCGALEEGHYAMEGVDVGI